VQAAPLKNSFDRFGQEQPRETPMLLVGNMVAMTTRCNVAANSTHHTLTNIRMMEFENVKYTLVWYLFKFQFSNGKVYMAKVTYLTKNLLNTENLVSIQM
jgi:hypothetical protein